jgi:hypothetical protein
MWGERKETVRQEVPMSPIHEAVTQAIRHMGHDPAHVVLGDLEGYGVRWAENMTASVVVDKDFIGVFVTIALPSGHPTRTAEAFVRLALPVVQHNCELDADDDGNISVRTGGEWDAANPHDTALIPYLRAWATSRALSKALEEYRERRLAPGDVPGFLADVFGAMKNAS